MDQNNINNVKEDIKTLVKIKCVLEIKTNKQKKKNNTVTQIKHDQ